MSSTKRNKQPSENNYRFQDIPPRFKRQKSLTSHKIQSAMESSNQNDYPSHKNKKPLGDSFTTNGSSIPHQSYQKGSQYPKEGRKIVKKLSTHKAQLNAEKSLLKPSTQPFVLSPMENKLFSLMRNDECESPEFSATVDQSRSLNSSPYLQQNIPQCPSFTNNSNFHRATPPNPSDPYGWIDQNQTHNQSFTPEQRFSPAPHVNRHSPTTVNNNVSNTNYSDPDIRTIEMLRELERVADQTDVGNNESSNDKSSLVSHHLRMLMCAVDRYTEGVDDEMDNDSQDEGLPLEQPRHIPTPPQTQITVVSPSQPQITRVSHPQPQFNGVSQYQEFSDNDSAFSEDSYTPSKPVDHFAAAAHHPMLNTWNPWATPSFNALDVYATNSPNANVNNIHPYHPSMYMFDYNNMYHARNSF